MKKTLTASRLAGLIDHALLRADATLQDLVEHCRQAREHGFATVAVNSAPVRSCARELEGSGVGVCAAVSFPLGQSTVEAKVLEAKKAIEDGATEIDFVINVGLLKSGRVLDVDREISELVAACGACTSKAILETGYLSDAEKQVVCEMAIRAGATFVKTCTGRGPRGVTLPDVLLLKSAAADRIKIKAAGGIKTLDEVLGYVDAGADRIGTSCAVSIMREAREVLPS